MERSSSISNYLMTLFSGSYFWLLDMKMEMWKWTCWSGIRDFVVVAVVESVILDDSDIRIDVMIIHSMNYCLPRYLLQTSHPSANRSFEVLIQSGHLVQHC